MLKRQSSIRSGQNGLIFAVINLYLSFYLIEYPWVPKPSSLIFVTLSCDYHGFKSQPGYEKVLPIHA